MAQAKLTIEINNWDAGLTVTHASLVQAYNQHHVFELSATVPVKYEITVSMLEGILGEVAILQIETDEGHICKFKGFVDEVIPTWTSHGAALRVKGYSPSILMDCIPRFRSFKDQTTNNILSKINSYGLPIRSNAENYKVGYSFQCQETDYHYICRVADDYGKVFYYDGEQFFFGKWASEVAKGKPIELHSNRVTLSMNLAPLTFELNGYELKKSEIQKQSYNLHKAMPINGSALDACLSKSAIYGTQPIHINHLISEAKPLGQIAKKMMTKQTRELVRINGSSSHAGLKIGSKINLKGSKGMLEGGNYIIINITHQVNVEGKYSNTFTAIPAESPFPIRMQQGTMPMSGPLMAIVRENHDPDNLGRVQVEFIGDEEKTVSPWLRVAVSYTQYGGMYFLPEKGDQVLVFHEDFNVEKSAFVMGCFYHGKSKATEFSDKDNKKKGILMDKIQFRFDDRTGKLIINANEIEINAKKKMKIDGGQHLKQVATRIDLN